MVPDGRSTSSWPRWSECREAARAVRRSPLPFRREAVGTARPRGVAGILRSHAPLSLLLLLASREGRLVWRSAGCFAVLERPLAENVPAVAGARALRLLDRYWDLVAFYVVPVALLVVAAFVGRLTPSMLLVAYVLIVAALAIVVVGLVSLAVLQTYRLLSGRRRMSETAVGQIRAMYWTMVLCHVDNPAQIDPLLDEAHRCGQSPAGTGTHPVLYLERGITTRQARARARSNPLVQQLSEIPPVYVVALPSDLPLEVPDEPGRFLGRDVAMILAGSMLVLFVLATFVPVAERDYCADPTSCAGRPITYGDALYWLFSRVLGGDPEGLGVASPFGRTVGLLLSFYGIVVLVGIIERVIEQQIEQNLASGPALVRLFNQKTAQAARLEKAEPRPRRRGWTWLRKALRQRVK